MYLTDIKEEKSFVITYNPETNHEYNYYVSTNDAFLIARNTRGYALVMCGRNRYRFSNGDPILSILKAGSTDSIQQGDDYESCFKR
jgi:hypothetical protein